MERKRRSEDELRGASDHLHYEIWMFKSLAKGLSTGIAGEGVIHNALLESFVIHTRILLGFFYAMKPWDADVIAEDFLTDPDKWLEARPEKSELLETVHKQVGKEAAHLTYARLEVTAEAKNWEFRHIESDITAALN